MIWNLGSINADNFYYLRHLPGPGETITAREFRQGLGGKGANMSVAAARAGTRVMHIGAVGKDGKWAKDRLLEYGVETKYISLVDTVTGHANICVSDDGENSIVISPGANYQVSDKMIGVALAEASPDDILLMQNETLNQLYAGAIAKTLGLRVIYAAAPFDGQTTLRLINYVDILVLNQVEAAELETLIGAGLDTCLVDDIIVTLGANGCKWVSNQTNTTHTFPAYKVDAIDTTGAGDTFTGYLAAALDRRLTMPNAITLAMQASALMVMRQGTADVIPDLKDIEDYGFDDTR